MRRQLFAVYQELAGDIDDVPAILGLAARDGDLVAGLKRLARPTGAMQSWRSTYLDHPVCERTVLGFCVEENLAMGIGEDEFGDCPSHCDGVFVVSPR